MYSVSEENYIKCIYHLEQVSQNVSTTALSSELKTRPASVTDMLKKLEQKQLLSHEKYYGCRLTPKGRALALSVIRRHRLWEFFLTEKLGFGWEEVHDIAEHLEHVQSAALTQKLDAYLGFPRFDPHGDPIPDAAGIMSAPRLASLLEQQPGSACTIASVPHRDAALLQMLLNNKLTIGARLQVIRSFPFDGSLEVQNDAGATINISRQLAAAIMIHPPADAQA